MLKLFVGVKKGPVTSSFLNWHIGSIKRMSSSNVETNLEPNWFKDQHGLEHYLAKTNQNFEDYYRSQAICDSELEWQECLAAMRRCLPQSFRINRSRPQVATRLTQILKDYRKNQNPRKVEVIEKSWCKDHLIWQLEQTSRWDIKENEDLKNFQEFLFHENEVGNISRQELVSMIPVLLLDIASHHTVLDMCSSPGSKTKQVAEFMLAESDFPEGVIVSNEFDPGRCDRLASNIARISCPNIMLVNHDGQIFPEIHKKEGDEVVPLRYDRIVCDVPCSGDGTIRKNPNVWLDWSPGIGNSRHFIQFNLAERGAELLAVGGLMAYSSCSINPIENEAVLARLIRQSGGALELVSCEGRLPGLRFAPGQKSWKVVDSKMREHNSFQEVPDNFKAQLHPGMWPSLENEALHLDRCLRFLPHHNDDGGFFVAIVRKTKPLPWEGKRLASSNDPLIESGNLSGRTKKNLLGLERKMKIKGKVEVPNRTKRVGAMWHPTSYFSFMDQNDTDLQKVLDFYGIPLRTDVFYAPLATRKTIYLTNHLLKNIIKHSTSGLNLYYAGAKVFAKESKTQSKVSHQIHPKFGACLLPKVTNRCLAIGHSDLVKLICSKDFTDISELSEEARNRLEPIREFGVGPIKLVYEGEVEVECMGFLGSVRISVNLSDSQRQHALFVIGEKKLV